MPSRLHYIVPTLDFTNPSTVNATALRQLIPPVPRAVTVIILALPTQLKLVEENKVLLHTVAVKFASTSVIMILQLASIITVSPLLVLRPPSILPRRMVMI